MTSSTNRFPFREKVDMRVYSPARVESISHLKSKLPAIARAQNPKSDPSVRAPPRLHFAPAHCPQSGMGRELGPSPGTLLWCNFGDPIPSASAAQVRSPKSRVHLCCDNDDRVPVRTSGSRGPAQIPKRTRGAKYTNRIPRTHLCCNYDDASPGHAPWVHVARPKSENASVVQIP
jgi:hypothetical protein